MRGKAKTKKKTAPPVKKKFDDQRGKVAGGGTWTYLLTMDNDVASAVIKDIDNSPGGIVLNTLLNNQLRKAYKLKQK